MTRTMAQGFSDFIDKLIPTESQRAKATSHRASIEEKLDSEFGIFRMCESGSFRHGTGVRYRSDVDFFVSLKSKQPALSSSILSSVRTVLKERFPLTEIHVSRPAVVLEFGSGYERVEIIPAYYQTTTNGSAKFEIPAASGDDWLESTPEAHTNYVDDCNKTPTKGAAKSLARMLKAWKYYRDVPVSSFYLEMRAAKYMAGEKYVDYAEDVYRILNQLNNAGLAAMQDPTGNTGYIYACSSDATATTARSRLATATSRALKARDAYKAGNIKEAFEWWDLVFNGRFPSYYS